MLLQANPLALSGGRIFYRLRLCNPLLENAVCFDRQLRRQHPRTRPCEIFDRGSFLLFVNCDERHRPTTDDYPGYYQPNHEAKSFFGTRPVVNMDINPGALDSGTPYDWTKPK